MANSFLNKKVDLANTDLTTLYTVPAEATGLVKSILVSNDDTTNDCHITVTLVNSSGTIFSLFKEENIEDNTTKELLSQPLVVEESEAIKVQAQAGDLHVVLSVLEITRD
jgi:hypothetical protein